MSEAERERAAVVAWLREEDLNWTKMKASYIKAGNLGPYLGGPSYHTAADAIERGDHMEQSDAKG